MHLFRLEFSVTPGHRCGKDKQQDEEREFDMQISAGFSTAASSGAIRKRIPNIPKIKTW
jgi:hypothetical protein